MTALPRPGAPFAFNPAAPRHFAGRAAELGVFEALLGGFLEEDDKPPVLVIEGRHGFGRSTLLRRARVQAQAHGLVSMSACLLSTWGWAAQLGDAGHTLVLLDDVDDLPASDLSHMVESLMTQSAHLAGKDNGLFLVLSSLPGIARRLEVAGLRSAALVLRIGPLSGLEARALLANAAAEFGETFTPEALSRIVAQAQGIPALLQIWGEVLWRQTVNSPITLSDVEAAAPAAFARIAESFLAPALARATRSERAYLAAAAAIARADDAFSSGEIEAHLLAGRGGRIDGGLRRRLLAKGLLYTPAWGELAFAHPGMREYLRSQAVIS